MLPFKDYDLFSIIKNLGPKLENRIANFTNEEILANDLEILADVCFEEFKITPVTLFEEDLTRREITQKNIQKRSVFNENFINIDGFSAQFFFPFEGDAILFQCRASTFTLGGYPPVEIKNNHLILSIEKALNDFESDNVKKIIDETIQKSLEQINNGIGFANKDVNDYNKVLRSRALNLLQKKKEKVEKFNTLTELLEIPLQRTSNAKTIIPLAKKTIPIAKHKDERSYYISDSEYHYILEIIKHNGSTYERTPSSYKLMNEEDLRNILLASLNGIYKGSAGGETFRNNGKTDICIEKENRAAFVAECKMWKGQKQVVNAIEQLESYLTWRDCKTALIYFVRTKDFFQITGKMKLALESHPSIRNLDILDRNEFDFCYYSKNPGHLISTRVMLFNLYC
jgi:hypothetical protein